KLAFGSEGTFGGNSSLAELPPKVPSEPKASLLISPRTQRLVDQPAPVPFTVRWGLVVLGLGSFLAWAFWPALIEIVDRWVQDSRYSHGYFVPVFAVALLWIRRKKLAAPLASAPVWGTGLLCVGLGLHLAG